MLLGLVVNASLRSIIAMRKTYGDEYGKVGQVLVSISAS